MLVAGAAAEGGVARSGDRAAGRLHLAPDGAGYRHLARGRSHMARQINAVFVARAPDLAAELLGQGGVRRKQCCGNEQACDMP